MASRLPKVVIAHLATLACLAYCQANEGALRLVVTDTTGHGLAAAIEIVSQGSQYARALSTNPNGLLDLTGLPFGLYRLNIRRGGFASVQSSIEIHSSIPTQFAVQMKLAPLTESVKVSSTDTLLAVDQAGSVDVIGKIRFASASAPFPAARCRIWSIRSLAGCLRAMRFCIRGDRNTRPSSSLTAFHSLTIALPASDLRSRLTAFNRSASTQPESPRNTVARWVVSLK